MFDVRRFAAVAASTAIAAGVIVAVPTSAQAITSEQVFSYSGADQQFTVPSGITSIDILASGASGGKGAEVMGVLGGLGGTAEFTAIPVTPGQVLTVKVGGMGVDGGVGSGGEGGFGGGGSATLPPSDRSGGGGGYSGVADGSTQLVIAGGGGGGGDGVVWTGGLGGNGGGTIGSDGAQDGGNDTGGGGGTQGAGGSGGVSADQPAYDGAAGTSLQGGSGGAIGGGGGGGGYFGGGGGASGGGNPSSGGGGGSGYSVVNTGSFGTAPAAGNGSVKISWTQSEPVVLAQTANCVTAPNGTTLKRGTVRQLMKAKCRTNAGGRVALRVATSRKSARGDISYYRLQCKVGSKPTTGTSNSGYGNGTRICESGAMQIVAGRHKVTVTISWSAPEKTGYAAYVKTKTYRIR